MRTGTETRSIRNTQVKIAFRPPMSPPSAPRARAQPLLAAAIIEVRRFPVAFSIRGTPGYPSPGYSLETIETTLVDNK
jgi:hypothetical protein